MKKHLGQVAALLGLAASAALILHDHPRTTWALLRTAGSGLLLAGLVHVLPMLANARAWQILLVGADRLGLAAMLRMVWIRESVNGLLPVARVGGEVVSFRMMRRAGLSSATAAGSLIVDLQLAMIGQLLLTLLGVGYLLTKTSSASLHLAGYVTWGAAAMAPLVIGFIFLQHAGPLERIAGLLDRFAEGKWTELVGQSAGIDRQIKSIWKQGQSVLRYVLLWYPVQCVGTALEIWLALRFLHAPIGLLDAIAIEILIQAASSAAFFVPAGLGVQEAAFVGVGSVFGLDAPTCLALAGARRVRDLLIFTPGLLAWQWLEGSAKGAPIAAATAA